MKEKFKRTAPTTQQGINTNGSESITSVKKEAINIAHANSNVSLTRIAIQQSEF